MQRIAQRKRGRPKGPQTQISEGQITLRVPIDLRARLDDELRQMKEERQGESLSLSDVIRRIMYAHFAALDGAHGGNQNLGSFLLLRRVFLGYFKPRKTHGKV